MRVYQRLSRYSQQDLLNNMLYHIICLFYLLILSNILDGDWKCFPISMQILSQMFILFSVNFFNLKKNLIMICK